MSKSDHIRAMLTTGATQAGIARTLNADPGLVCRVAKQMGMASGRPPARVWSDAEIASIRELNAAGVTQTVIAERMGVSQAVMCKLMKRHGIAARKEVPQEVRDARAKLEAERAERRAARVERARALREEYLAKRAASCFVRRGRPPAPNKTALRERIAEMKLAGKTNREIGEALGMSRDMVRYHAKGLIIVRRPPPPPCRLVPPGRTAAPAVEVGQRLSLACIPGRSAVRGPFSGDFSTDQSNILESMRADAIASQARMAAIFAEGEDEEIAA